MTFKGVTPLPTSAEIGEICRQEAETLHRSGSYHCAEAVLAAIRKHFRPDLSEDTAHLASGFGGGSGAGCICGAVAGATIALALVLRNDKKRISRITRELHIWFKEIYDVTCCKTIRTVHSKDICPLLTGKVAGKLAELLQLEGARP